MSFRKMAIAGCIASLGALVLHGELRSWLQHIEATNPVEGLLYRTVSLPAGPVKSRRPPKETVAALAQRQANAALYSLRAREAEQALNFTQAEDDWKRYADAAQDKVEGAEALAEYYGRRVEPDKEIAALLRAAAVPSSPSDETLAFNEQRQWRALTRAVDVARMHQKPLDPILERWMERYPNTETAYLQAFQARVDAGQTAEAESIIAAYRTRFPNDPVFPISARASLEERRGGVSAAIAVYESAFQPLMPPELVKQWFDAMGKARKLREFLAGQRSSAASRPTDLTPAVKLFYYWQQQRNLDQAQRALLEFEQAKKAANSPFSAQELSVLARLFEDTHEYREAARLYAQLMKLNAAPVADAERGMSGLIRVLLTAPEQPIRIGAGDLSYWRDVATMDPYPGTANGILSLLFNTTYPQSEFQQQERLSVAYFHRAEAARLMAEFDSRFPSSNERASLRAKLIEAYATHGDNDGVIRRGKEYLQAFPKSPHRVEVGLAVARAYARKNQINEELAVYASLLDELAAASGNVPLGSAATASNEPGSSDANDLPAHNMMRANQAARSPDYARVLDLYISRLVSAKRVRDALAVYRAQIAKNPSDPGIYARLATFLDQNKLATELEQTYAQAMRQFSDRSWAHKLARFYLRTKQTQQFTKLTRDITATFSGTDLEQYFAQMGAQGVDSKLYLQLNLYAHQRFPHDLVFVRNLLGAYSTKGTADAAAWESLLRQHWYDAEDLRNRFFQHLSATGKLEAELKSLEALATPAHADRAVEQFVAEGYAWRGYFEEAAPKFRTLAANYPAEETLAGRAASLHRSLGDIPNAIAITERLIQAEPGNTTTLARAGEIWADREDYAKARPFWNRISAVAPGDPAHALESATVFWDYFLFDDALRVIREARTRLKQPTLYAYEAGAILENKRQYPEAVQEYLAGAIANEPNEAARSRLIRLARMPRHRDLVESASRQLVAGSDPPLGAFNLRLAVLLNQGRSTEVESLLRNVVGRTNSWEVLARIDETATNQGFDSIREASLNRQIALTGDPVEKMRLRITLARFYESRKDAANAGRTIDSLYRDHPRILGVVRARADYYWRNKNWKEALQTLESAAAASNPSYKKEFTLEAANKATTAGEYALARRVLQPYLEADPLAPELLTSYANTYAREGNTAALSQFYKEKIVAAGKAELASTLRRSLVPVLTRAGDYAAATEQYIQLMNRYPDDVALLNEAAAYARAHNTVPQLVGFYSKAATDSPRDARWPVILARIHVATEAPADALASYARAVAIRPERRDLWAEKGTLEEKLLKWSDAAQTYSKLYELSYRNPAWMVRVAQNQARLKQPDAVVKSLRTAFLEGKPDRATEYFEIARKLSDWGMLTEAQQFADQGFPKLKPRDPENLADLRTYISLAARARTYEAAYAKLSSVVEPSSRAFLFLELANVARQYFTPEEKTVLGGWFRKLSAADPGLDLTGAANAAGLADVEVALLIDRMRRGPGPGSPSDVQRLADLQKRRMRFDDLANQIEAYTKQLPPDGGRNDYLPQVADAFRLGGSYNNELRVLGVLDQMSLLSGPSVARYNFLLRTAQPTKLIQVAQSGSSVEIRNGAAQTAISGDDASLALRAVAARGAGLPPVWTKAYTALTGLHFAQVSPEVEAAFTGALGTLTVGEQLGHIPDRAQQLVGAAWFPYGASYGMYLRISGKNAEAEDYLPAALEGRPASARAYASLAETYAEAGDAAQALTEYTHALQFNHLNPEVQTRMALLESGRGNMREATEHLRSALMILAEQQDRGSVPESFWNDTVLTLEAIGRLKAFNALRKEATTLLSTYFRRNDTYRAEPLIRAALNAPESASEGFAWVQELARSSVAPVGFLSSIIDVSWLTDEQKLLLNAQILEISNLEVARTRGQANEYAVLARDRTKIDYASALVKAGRLQEASAQLNELSATARVENQQKLLLVEAQIAARSNSLPALLDRYAQMEAPPSNDLLRSVANTLRAEGNKTASLIILERVYQADVAAVWPPPSASLLGLAEVRLEQGNAQKAVAELRRAVLLSEEGPSLIDSAASLLERFGRNVEAEEFRVRIASMAPWDRSNLAALALLKKDNAALGSLARSPETPYSSRAAAASVLAGATDLGSGELNYLANPTQDPKDAEKPYWFAARVKAAERSQDPAVKFRLLRGAIEIDPSAEAIRLPLFRAALAVNRNQGAVGVWAPLLDAGPVGRVLVQFRDTNDGTDVRYLTTEFLSAYPDRALIARELAGAYRKLGYLPAAEMLLRISQRIAPSPSIEAEIAQLEAEQKAVDANARRAPVIRQALEMEKPVRPRLLVSSAKPATITGGAR